MFKEVQLSEIETDGFLHSRVNKFIYDHNNKTFIMHINHIDLKIKGSFYSCTITITDWWDFEVIQYRGNDIINKFKSNNIPELDGIVDFTYDGTTLTLEDLCGLNEIYHFIFIKPKIQITGEYEPD